MNKEEQLLQKTLDYLYPERMKEREEQEFDALIKDMEGLYEQCKFGIYETEYANILSSMKETRELFRNEDNTNG